MHVFVAKHDFKILVSHQLNLPTLLAIQNFKNVVDVFSAYLGRKIEINRDETWNEESLIVWILDWSIFLHACFTYLCFRVSPLITCTHDCWQRRVQWECDDSVSPWRSTQRKAFFGSHTSETEVFCGARKQKIKSIQKTFLHFGQSVRVNERQKSCGAAELKMDSWKSFPMSDTGLEWVPFWLCTKKPVPASSYVDCTAWDITRWNRKKIWEAIPGLGRTLCGSINICPKQ